jgi:hypothetical protein
MSFVETTEVLGNIGDLVGAVAVVLSLIYLAIQIRRNTEALQLSASESISRSVADINRILIESAEMNEIYLRGASDPSSLTQGENNRFNALVNILVYGWQRNYYSHKLNTLDSEIWDAQCKTIEHALRQPGYRNQWNNVSPYLGRSFSAFVNQRLVGSNAPS